MARMARATGPIKAKVLQEEIERQGITMSEAIERVVTDFLGNKPTENQVRDLATSLAKLLGVRVERFVALWREARFRR